MIILGIVLLLIVWLVAPSVPAPPPIWELVHAAGVILVVVGFILLILSFVTGGVGPGFGPPVRGRRIYW